MPGRCNKEVALVTTQPQPYEVKQIVARVFLDLGATSAKLFGIRETMFIDRGLCIARSYRADSLKAVWQIDEGIVEFYDADGELVRTLNLLQRSVPQAMAA
jgi:hypothetical protein